MVAGQSFTLRQDFTASYLLAKWGITPGFANYMEVAASQCGHFDSDGEWHNHGFKSPMEFIALITKDVDKLEPDQVKPYLEKITAAAMEAEKKVLRLQVNSPAADTSAATDTAVH